MATLTTHDRRMLVPVVCNRKPLENRLRRVPWSRQYRRTLLSCRLMSHCHISSYEGVSARKWYAYHIFDFYISVSKDTILQRWWSLVFCIFTDKTDHIPHARALRRIWHFVIMIYEYYNGCFFMCRRQEVTANGRLMGKCTHWVLATVYFRMWHTLQRTWCITLE